MLGVASLLVLVGLATASVLPVRPERKVADADFVKRQKLILNIYAALGHNQQFKSEYADWDISAHFGNFVDEKYPREFLAAYKQGFLPYDAVFSMACPHTFHDFKKLFDVFYFAKDFNTFYSAARWAKHHINPTVFAYAFTLALTHRPDTQNFVVPPLYEVFPNYFVPLETLHKINEFKMSGHKEGRFNYNNTGYEYYHHSSVWGGVLNAQNLGYGDFRISYFREDVGLNSWFASWFVRNPSWMCPEKYGNVRFERRGENFYYSLQQLFARYTLERLANALPFTTVLNWEKPIQVGYNPRVTYFNGQPMYVRPDNFVTKYFNPVGVKKVEAYEKRIWDTIDAQMLWEISNNSLINLRETNNIDNGMELLGRVIYGTTDRPSRSYYKSYYYAGLDALAYAISTGSDKSFIGNALSTPMTALRDPAFYNYIARILLFFQHYKKSIGPYHKEDVVYPGVTIRNVEVDRFLTYFDMYDFEVTSSVPMQKEEDFIDHKYFARQYRLNHKPYRFNVTVNSEVAGDAMVRVFLGPKYDSDEHTLTYEQARLAYFEIDRFPVKLSNGVNVWERSSTESPIFTHDPQGFSSLYASLNNAASQKEQFYIHEGGNCGLPDRLQLPMGWKGGRTYVLSVVVTPYDKTLAGNEKYSDVACGGSRLYDGRAMGFPFDRPIKQHEFDEVPNIFFKDVPIYHKEASDINRPA